MVPATPVVARALALHGFRRLTCVGLWEGTPMVVPGLSLRMKQICHMQCPSEFTETEQRPSAPCRVLDLEFRVYSRDGIAGFGFMGWYT